MCFLRIQVIFTDVDYNFILKADIIFYYFSVISCYYYCSHKC